MAFDSWGVMPGLEEDEFILAERDLAAAAGQAESFMRESEPMSEKKIREELKKREAPEELVDIRIAKAKEEWKKSP
jgi:hypothetical protein